jgi:folate-binding protein YgfZ
MSDSGNSEGQRARPGALLVVELDRGTLRVTGPDRATWLNGLVTCDVSKVDPERAALGLVLSKHGKILSDLWVAASSDALYLSVAPGQHGVLVAYLERLLVMEDAEVVDVSSDHAWLSLHGPDAGAEPRRAARRLALAEGELDLTGLGGCVAVVERAQLDAACEALVASGAVRAEPLDWETLRIERGLPMFGVDYGLEDNPHEAGLDQRAVSWTKGCYLGQEVVCMQGMRGKVKRRVVSLRVDGAQALERGTVLRTPDQAEVGEVTSAVPNESEGCVVALGRVAGVALDGHEALSAGGRGATIVEPIARP